MNTKIQRIVQQTATEAFALGLMVGAVAFGLLGVLLGHLHVS